MALERKLLRMYGITSMWESSMLWNELRMTKMLLSLLSFCSMGALHSLSTIHPALSLQSFLISSVSNFHQSFKSFRKSDVACSFSKEERNKRTYVSLINIIKSIMQYKKMNKILHEEMHNKFQHLILILRLCNFNVSTDVYFLVLTKLKCFEII